MYTVSDDYITKSTSLARPYTLKVEITNAEGITTEWLSGCGVLKLKITRGQTTGTFELGQMVCAQLSVDFSEDVTITVSDEIRVYVAFGLQDSLTEWQGLGIFYADSVTFSNHIKSVRAYDMALKLSKPYKTKMMFPKRFDDVLTDLTTNEGLTFSENFYALNNPKIIVKPVISDPMDAAANDMYYTIREMIGYIAAVNGGFAYVDVDGVIRLATPTETRYGIPDTSVIARTEDDASFYCKKVEWKSATNITVEDEEETGNILKVSMPLQISDATNVMLNLNERLHGLTFNAVKIKKQGTGIYQLGDLILFSGSDNQTHKMLAMGIVYDFSNGFFSEELYSLAKSTSERDYVGGASQAASVGLSGDFAVVADTNGVEITTTSELQRVIRVVYTLVDERISGFCATSIFNVTTAGTVVFTLKINTNTIAEYTEVYNVGNHFKSITHPVLSVNGRNDVAIFVHSPDGAVAEFPERLTTGFVVGDGVGGTGAWDGMIELREAVPAFTMVCPTARLSTFTDAITTAVFAPVSPAFSETGIHFVSAIPQFALNPLTAGFVDPACPPMNCVEIGGSPASYADNISSTELFVELINPVTTLGGAAIDITAFKVVVVTGTELIFNDPLTVTFEANSSSGNRICMTLSSDIMTQTQRYIEIQYNGAGNLINAADGTATAAFVGRFVYSDKSLP